LLTGVKQVRLALQRTLPPDDAIELVAPRFGDLLGEAQVEQPALSARNACLALFGQRDGFAHDARLP